MEGMVETVAPMEAVEVEAMEGAAVVMDGARNMGVPRMSVAMWALVEIPL
jgi:hypothetical protein